MSYLLPEVIEKYVEEHTRPISMLLEELEIETNENTDCPQMLCGKVEGKLLQLLIKISGVRTVVEIGTFTGYSALMMAEGLPEDGKLITCEINKRFAGIARRYFKKSQHLKKIVLKIGPAIDTLKDMQDESVDFVFIDADKPSYPIYYDESIRILRRGGLIVVDNALWSGNVIYPEDENSRAISLFNKKVKDDKRTEKVMLTVRDGIYLIRKK